MAALLSVISSKYILPAVINFISYNDKTIKNYRGKTVYNSCGIFLSFNTLLICIFMLFYDFITSGRNVEIDILILIIGTLSSSFTGILDDNSNDVVKGLKGHAMSVLKGKLTAGSIKAFVGIMTSLIICIIANYSGLNFLINFLLIPGAQNIINLLDLRPGRAIKSYIVLSIVLIPFLIPFHRYSYINLSLIISLFFYLSYELSEICIMGNIGSNVLGSTIGIMIISVDSTLFRIVMLVIFTIIQIYAEQNSISVLIENNHILSFFDMLGRKKSKDDKNKKRHSSKSDK